MGGVRGHCVGGGRGHCVASHNNSIEITTNGSPPPQCITKGFDSCPPSMLHHHLIVYRKVTAASRIENSY